MKRVALLGVVLIGLILLAACGTEQLIEKPAGEINLRPEDLGESYRLEREENLEGLLKLLDLEEAPGFLEANLRIFTGTLAVSPSVVPTPTQVIAAVLRCDSSGGAQGALQEIHSNVEGGLNKQAEGRIKTEKLEPPEIAEGEIEVVFSRATVTTTAGLRGESYLLFFRRRNVLGFLVTAGPAGAFREEEVVGLAGKMAGRVPLPQP
ncbi:MAG: hypothetical protein ACP5OO_07280 [Chloroflexia bacterium]